MLIHCPYCIARVNASVEGVVVAHASETECYRVSLLECPACHRAVVAQDERVEIGEIDEPDVWSAPVRMWPEPDSDISVSIPAIVRMSLVEANLCLRAGAFTGSVVMTGRALEAMCHHFQTKSRTMAQGLKEC